MRRITLLFGLVVLSLAFASSAMAGATVPVSMTLVETFAKPQNCPDIALAFNCGSGVVVPFGHATEEIGFGIGCGGTCDFRRVDLATGSIFLDETASAFSCPGACGSHGINPPFTATLSDVVVGGTGIFEGATGSLSGTVNADGQHAQIKLSGTITVDP